MNDNELYNRLTKHTKIHDFQQYMDENTNMNYLDSKQRTFLMLAAQNYHIQVFVYLIKNHHDLMNKIDHQQRNIFHYIACTRTDNQAMIHHVMTTTNKTYHNLIWMKDINGLLPKNIAKQCGNHQIFNALDKMMRDSSSEYQIEEEDDDLIEIKKTETATKSLTILQSLQLNLNKVSSSPHTPSKKRKFCRLNEDNEDPKECGNGLNSDQYGHNGKTKRRKLNEKSKIFMMDTPSNFPPSLCLEQAALSFDDQNKQQLIKNGSYRYDMNPLHERMEAFNL